MRQVFEKTFGNGVDKLFGGTAIETGKRWQQAGLARTPDQAGGVRPGDVLFQMSGSGGNGHVGIVGADGLVYENSTRGAGGKMATPLNRWGQVDLVGRYGGWGDSGASVPAGSAKAFIQAIAAQESGNSYTAVNGRTGALGKYQVMPQNILGWGKQAGKKGVGWDYEALGYDITPQQYLASPKLQDKIAQFQLQKAYGKYGAAGAARWWYSNSAQSSDRRPAAGEPTPNEYAAQVLGRMGGGYVGGAGGAGGATQTVIIKGEVKINGQTSAAITQATAQQIAKQLTGQGIKVQIKPARVQSARPGA